MKYKIVVSRRWDKDAPIKAFCSDEEVGASMELDYFMSAVAVEIGNPALLLTATQLKNALLKASFEVLSEMKQATKAVV